MFLNAIIFTCLHSTPLPPLPSEKRMQMDGISNRSSCSSGAYGHFIAGDNHIGGTDVDDDVYSKPMVCL